MLRNHHFFLYNITRYIPLTVHTFKSFKFNMSFWGGKWKVCLSGFSDPLRVFFKYEVLERRVDLRLQNSGGKKTSNFFEDLREEMILMDFFCCSSFVLSAFL